jgi:outer membrane protein OmpA-like peptidoglycan-associated protein
MCIRTDKAQELIKRLNHLILKNAGKGYSDIHITGGLRLAFRKNGVPHFGETDVWSTEEIECLVNRLLSVQQLETLKEKKSVAIVMDVKHARIMAGVYVTTIGLSLTVNFLSGWDPAADKKKSDMPVYEGRLLELARNTSFSFVAKIALVTLVIICVAACTWLDVIRKPPVAEVTMSPDVPSSAGEARVIENNRSINAVTATVNLQNTPGKEGGTPRVTVSPGICRDEYGGTAIEAVQGQMYLITGGNEKIPPFLPMPEKRLIVPLAIRMSEEARHQVPTAKISSSPSSSRPMPAPGENTAGLVEGTAKTSKRSNAAQTTMSNPYGKAVIYFPANHYLLTDSEKDQIKLFLPHLKMAASDGYMALVQGYTCDLGSKDRNDFLAMERAKAVAGYLEQNGVKIGGIKGEGKHGYISKNRKLNRRVEIETSKKTEPQEQS